VVKLQNGKILTDADLKKEWNREERKKIIVQKAEEKKKLETAYEETPPSAEEEAIKSDWSRLVDLARLRFPDQLAAKFDITPAQRVAAIAYSLGWTQAKIAVAAGVHVDTVRKWLSKDAVQEFTTAFQYHTGSKDSREIVDNEQYTSIQVLKDLRDDPTVSASTRKEIAMWFFEQKHGKAKETREIKGVNLRDLTEQLMKARQTEADKQQMLSADPLDGLDTKATEQ
jgi:DNA-binding transcriptional regulator YiaG